MDNDVKIIAAHIMRYILMVLFSDASLTETELDKENEQESKAIIAALQYPPVST